MSRHEVFWQNEVFWENNLKGNIIHAYVTKHCHDKFTFLPIQEDKKLHQAEGFNS